MSGYRAVRIARTIMRELATAIAQEVVQDPRISRLVTLCDATLSSDYSRLTVLVGGVMNRRSLQRSVAGLNSARGFLQRHLNQRLRLRRVPHLQFVPHITLKKNFDMVQRLDISHPRTSTT